MSGYLVLSTAFLTHPEVSDQVDQQECVRVDSGTGVTQKLSTDFIRVVPQTSRNQFGSNPTRVRIPPAAPRRSKVRFAPTSFYAYGKKDVIRPLPCSSFPNRNRFAGLRFGCRRCAAAFLDTERILLLTATSKTKGHPYGCPFVLGSAAQRAAPPFGISMLGVGKAAPSPR